MDDNNKEENVGSTEQNDAAIKALNLIEFNKKESSSEGEEGLKGRIEKLDDAFEKVKGSIEKECKGSLLAIFICLVICGAAIGTCYLYADEYILNKPLDATLLWWQVLYFTACRIVVSAALIAFTTFTFKLLKSYLHIYQNNRHKRMVIRSMASLLTASSPKGVDDVFKELMDVVIQYTNSGFMKKGSNIEPETIYNTIKKMVKEKE